MYSIIVNPLAGNGRGKEILVRVERLMNEKKRAYRVWETHAAHDAVRFAHEICRISDDGIIAIGGDGTFYEIVNGMQEKPNSLYFVPAGTANDFMRVLKLPDDPIEALKVQLHNPLQPMDVCRVNDFRFLNVAGAGFDGEVLRHTEAFRSESNGIRAYMKGLRAALKFYQPIRATVEIDGVTLPDSLFTIISIGNGQYIGGGMKAVPHADPYDHFMDVVVVRALRKWQVAMLIPLFLFGLHTHIPASTTHHCQHVRITSHKMTFNMDGELERMDVADITVLPGALNTHCALSSKK